MRSFKLAQTMAIVAIAVERLAGQSAAPTPPPGYAGSEICASCHEDLAKAFSDNPHHGVEADKKRGWEGRACEACHGPAQKHTESASAEEIRNPAKLTAAATDKICLTCHLGQPTLAGHLQSSHAKNQVACTTCHKIHANGPAGYCAQNHRGDQHAVRSLSPRCSGAVSKTVSPPRAGRGDVAASIVTIRMAASGRR